MRKVLNVITLIVMLCVNVINPFTYATSSWDIFVETQEIDEIAVENGDFGENEEIPDEDQDTEDDADIDENAETDEDSELDEDSDEETDEDIDDETEVWSGTQVEIDENEIEELTWDIEILSWDTVELAGEVVELTGDISELVWKNLELLIARETLDDWLIKKSASYNDVTVNVEAQPWTFPQWTELRIKPITLKKELNEIKDQVSNTDENISEKSLVAFDITFIYVLSGWEEVEVQPKNVDWVKVVFNYENNKNLSEADTNDEQEIKVFHIDDKDENGEKVEKWDEVVKDVTNRVESDEEWIVVANAESFSIYAIVTTEENVSSLRVTHNLRGWYWMEDHSTASKIIEYTCSNWSCETTMHYRTPSKTWYMFIWWYDETLTNRRKDWVATDGMTVYAKWQEFGDLDVYIIENESNSWHYTLMDRNLWAKVIYNWNYSNPNEGSRWYYYQWWNNYGFDEYTTDNLPLSPIVSETKNVSSYSRSNPYYSSFFRWKEDQSIKNWMTSLNKKLWWDDGNNEVSRQWPCPDWYHIPTKAEYGNILSLYNKLINVSKEKLTRYLLMPPAWIRDRWFSALGKVFNSSYYYRYITSSWNNTDFSNKAVWFFGADNDDVNNLKLDKEWSANGLSARCFMNNETLNDKYNIYLNWWEDAIITILSWVVQSFNVPYRNFYDFDWWYTSPNFEWDPIEVWSVLLPWSSLYAKWIRYDVYTITYNLNWWFMKFSNNTRESNLQEYAENTNNFTLNNPVKLNSVFVWRSWTNLSNPTLTVTIPRWSTWNRVYEALYECELGYALDENNDCVWIRNADWTLNFDEWEYWTVDFVVWNTKITMLDRNLWATSNDINDAESQGFYYKWWNNYWFSLDHATKYGVTNERILNVTWYWPWTPSWYYTSPDWIYAWENDQAWNWFINANFDLWWDVTDTLWARQGPCPNEYHIPSDNEVSSVINLLSEFANTSTGMQCISLYWNKRKCFQNLVKLPDSGYIKSNSSSSSSKTETNRIFLWTSSDYNNKSITAFHSTQSQSDMTTWERSSAAGMQVRCFKNINNVTVKYNFNWWYYWDNIYSKPDIEDDWYNLNKIYVSPLGLQMKRENSTFSWWYLDAEFTKPFTWGTVFPYVTQDTTFYAKFDCNEWYIPSQDGKSCTLEVFSSCELPWWGYAAHASSVTWYKENSETCPAQCSEVAQVATCNNGVWNVEWFTWTYVKSSCTTQEVTIPAEYTLNTCPLHGNCSSMTWYTVSNNACVLWDEKYRLDSCEAHYHKTWDNTQCEIDSFEITWKYMTETGLQIETWNYVYGSMPSHAGNNYQTAQTGYIFNGWNPGVTSVTWPATYTAKYNETVRKYDIIWKYRDANGSRIEEIRKVEYGKNPEAPTLPSISQTAQTGYTFTWWNPEVSSPVTTWAEYTAQYEETLRTYLIAWQDYDGSMISWSLYNYGDRLIIPADPTRPEDENNIYEFIWWSPNVSEFVTGNRFYKAQYEAHSKKTPSWWWGSSSGWWWRRIPDISDKDIDGIIKDITDDEWSKIHGSAEENNAENREIQVPLITKQNMRKYSEQVIDSYIWAFDNNITTINEFDKANPDGTITRWLLAKMVVNYTRNILWKEIPLDTPTKCNWKDDTKEWKSQEIKFYAEKACALWVMWIKMDKFNPNKIVSRAEFWTTLSRLLWWDKYDVRNSNKNNPYYVNHLKVLKENGIMNDIDNPLWRKELRKWIWVMLRRIEVLNRKRVWI